MPSFAMGALLRNLGPPRSYVLKLLAANRKLVKKHSPDHGERFCEEKPTAWQPESADLRGGSKSAAIWV
jgi:hypothetical protein